MDKSKFLIVALLAFLATGSVLWFGGFFGYKNFEECILDRMEGVTSDVAAHQIRRACRQLTETKNNIDTCDEIFNADDRRGVTGQGRILSEFLYIDLYNPNRNLKISKIEVTVEGVHGNTDFRRDLILRRSSPLLPLSSGEFSTTLGLRNVSGWSWRLNAIYGCSAR